MHPYTTIARMPELNWLYDKLQLLSVIRNWIANFKLCDFHTVSVVEYVLQHFQKFTGGAESFDLSRMGD